LRGPRWIGSKCFAIEEQQFPDSDRAADIEWKPEVVIARLAGNSRQCFQIGEKVAQVVEPHTLIGRVRQRRIKMLVRR
jgi:hypothetical protein